MPLELAVAPVSTVEQAKGVVGPVDGFRPRQRPMTHPSSPSVQKPRVRSDTKGATQDPLLIHRRVLRKEALLQYVLERSSQSVSLR